MFDTADPISLGFSGITVFSLSRGVLKTDPCYLHFNNTSIACLSNSISYNYLFYLLVPMLVSIILISRLVRHLFAIRRTVHCTETNLKLGMF